MRVLQKHQGDERLGKPEEFSELRGYWREVPSRWNVESWTAAWNRKRAPVFLKEEKARGMKPSSPGRRAPASASVPLLLCKYCHFLHVPGEIEAAQRPKTRPMASLSINPPASILQTGRWPGAASEISDPNQTGVGVFYTDPHTCGLQFGPGFIFRRQPRTY